MSKRGLTSSKKAPLKRAAKARSKPAAPSRKPAPKAGKSTKPAPRAKPKPAKKAVSRKPAIKLCPLCGFKPFTGAKHPYRGISGKTLAQTKWCDGKKVIAPARKPSAPAKKTASKAKKPAAKKPVKKKAAPKKLSQREQALLKQLAAFQKREKELKKREAEQKKRQKALKEREKKEREREAALKEEQKLLRESRKKRIKVETEEPVTVKTPKKREGKKEKPLVVSPLNQSQIEALRREGIFERPKLCPTLDEISSENYKKSFVEPKQLVGRAVKKRNQEKMQELEAKWLREGVSRREIHRRLEDKKESSKIGINTYARKRIDVLKMNVDFDPEKPVHIFPEAARATSVTLREYFRPFAEQFLDSMRDKTENAYILRVKTLNWLPGVAEPREEGIGIERHQLSTFIPKEQLPRLKERYPGLTYDQLLRQRQLEQLQRMLKDLFEYFEDRFEQYLGRKMMTSMAVTGFSMEVVEKVLEENVDRHDK